MKNFSELAGALKQNIIRRKEVAAKKEAEKQIWIEKLKFIPNDFANITGKLKSKSSGNIGSSATEGDCE